MKHKWYCMIVAKAGNMDLVVFIKCGNHKWEAAETPTQFPLSEFVDVEYFLCLPQHKEACLHWLNGGEVETDRSFGDFVDVYPASDFNHKWDSTFWYMLGDYKSRIKPQKEKRWIAIYSDGTVCDRNKRTKEEIATYVERAPFYNNCAPENWQFIEIEVEV